MSTLEVVYLQIVLDLDDGTMFTIVPWQYAQEAVASSLTTFAEQMDVLRPLLLDDGNYVYGPPVVRKLVDTGDGIGEATLPYDIDDIIGEVLDGSIVQLRQPYTLVDTGNTKHHWYGIDIWKAAVR